MEQERNEPDETLHLAPLPIPLRWELPPKSWSAGDGSSLTITAGSKTDLFIDPEGTAEALTAPRLVGTPQGDFVVSARVTVGFSAIYDAGVLLLWAHERAWAKLCFELSPQRDPMIVSVVTRGLSDDSNAFAVSSDHVWLRVARLGQAYAFHASADGAAWRLIRYFALGGAEDVAVGFSAQSPTGDECTAVFEDIRFAPRRLGDIRSGE
ncbi:DUF1349 domain-containing protein [Sorangium sp. So ce260]|uniref:DUF1349 domain-containing protein n=1 Tax=Sorangium sp. So ce260 TaxID=3133291 RepID=UPI003F635C69